MRTRPLITVVGCLLSVAACAPQSVAGSDAATPSTSASGAGSSTTTTSTTPTTSTTSTTLPSTSTTSSTTTSTTTTTTTTTSSTTTTTVAALPDPWMTNANRAFDVLALANPAATMTVVRDGRNVLNRAWGITIDGAPAASDTPMVVASVSKLVTALMIAQLHELGSIDLDAPMPWTEVTSTTHPGWADVTVRELLAHTSGMPVVRRAWFDGGLDCASFLPSLLDRPPTSTRGRWTYSNGNYCALGLLVAQVTGLPLDRAAHALLFDPINVPGARLTTDGQLPDDIEYRLGVARLSRLGGAGSFIVSTDDIAALLANVTPADRDVLTWPGVLADQYGWGHTGSIDGAVACAWVLEGGRTTVAATISGGTPATGGEVCDRLVPAVADDLGIGQGPPDRSPP